MEESDDSDNEEFKEVETEEAILNEEPYDENICYDNIGNGADVIFNYIYNN